MTANPGGCYLLANNINIFSLMKSNFNNKSGKA